MFKSKDDINVQIEGTYRDPDSLNLMEIYFDCLGQINSQLQHMWRITINISGTEES